MTGVRKVRMRTYLRTARTLSGVLRRGARPRLSGGAHGAQTHRSMRTPSAHPLGPVLALVATYPGPRPTTDDPASQAAYAEQVLAWLRHDHPDEWRDYLAHVARHLQQEGYHRGPAHKAGTGELSPQKSEHSLSDLLPRPRRP